MKQIKTSILIILTILVIGLESCNSIKQKHSMVTFGMITDVHQDLQKDAQSRLSVFIDKANEVNPDFIIQLGDLSHGEQIDSILQIWHQFKGDNYHVLGNHDSDHMLKDSILVKQEMPGRYYAYDKGGIHFIVLDLNYILDDGVYKDFGFGNNYPMPADKRNLISPKQLEWLDKDLSETDKPAIIFTHQGIGKLWEGYQSPSDVEIRKVLEKHNGKEKKVIACFSGDQHVDSHQEVNGIHYFQVNSASYFWIEEAAIYSNGHMAVYKDPLFAFVTIDINNRTIEIEGTKSEFLPPAPTADNYSEFHKVFPEIKSRKVQF